MHLFLRNLFAAGKAAYSASKEGAELQMEKAIHVYSLGYWSWTPESCLDFTRETRAAVRAAFQEMDGATQHVFTFAPGRGGRVQRARVWRELLKPALPSAQYSEAMLKILRWLIRISKEVEA